MPEPQTNRWRPSHSGIHHTLHSYAEAGSIFDHLLSRYGKPLVRFLDGNNRISLCYDGSATLRAMGAGHLESLLWLWDLIMMERPGCIRRTHQEPTMPGRSGGLYCLFIYSLFFLCHQSANNFVLILGGKGKRNWTQCKNSKGVLGEELHRWSHCWR